jgi:predicted ferric reductase
MVGLTHSLLSLTASGEIGAAASRVGNNWTWYIIRGAGLASAGLMILLMISGIAQVTGLMYRLVEPIKAWLIHKTLGISLLVTVAVHIFFLLFDHFMPFNLAQILIPFVSHYSNGSTILSVGLGGIAVALGILAMYGIVVIVASSLGWIDSHKGLWQKLHYVSYFVLFAVLIHALGTGSDLKYGTFRAGWLALSVVLAGLLGYRLWRAGSLRRS